MAPILLQKFNDGVSLHRVHLDQYSHAMPKTPVQVQDYSWSYPFDLSLHPPLCYWRFGFGAQLARELKDE